MGGREYHESHWQQVPEGVEPVEFARRREFLLARVRAGQSVLDVGCGEALFASELAAAGAQPTAIDVAEEPLRRARRRAPGLDLRLAYEDRPWPLHDASFDVVWAGEVIEHVADTAGWLSEVRRVLRSGGLLLLSTPDHGPLRVLTLAVHPGAFDRHFAPRSDHLRFYTRRTLTALLADFGFESIDVRRVGGVYGARRLLLVSARRAGFRVSRGPARQ